MAYRLKLSEPMSEGIRRIAGEEIDLALIHVEATGGDGAVTAVHEARKCLKRTRALLRFGRPLFEPDAYRRASAAVRQVGRAMSATRDLDVIGLTLAHLQQAEALKPATLARLADLLAAARLTGDAVQITDERRASMIAELREFRAGVMDVDLGGADHALVIDGIADCLADCRKGFAQAFDSDDGDGDAFHDWRKSIQLHWRQMQLVERAWPAYCHARIVEARAISMRIGTDRDLGLLQAFVHAQAVPKLLLKEVDRMVARPSPLTPAAASPAGARLLAEGTGGFCRRLEGHWAAARALRKAKRDEADTAAKPRAAKPKAQTST